MAWAMTRVEDHIIDLMEPIEERRKHNEQRIAWQMRRVAERYARKEKAAKSGYQTNDEAYYESATLGQLLPFVIASVIDGTVLEQAQEMIRDGQPKGSSSPAEGQVEVAVPGFGVVVGRATEEQAIAGPANHVTGPWGAHDARRWREPL